MPLGNPPNHRLPPPSVPEGLLQAIHQSNWMDKESKELPVRRQEWETSSHVPASIDRVRTATAKVIADETRDVFDWEEGTIMEQIRWNSLVTTGFSSASFLASIGCVERESLRAQFFGKRLLDIGGGFSGLGPLLAKVGANVTVADPIFFEPDALERFRSEKSRISQFIEDAQAILENPRLATTSKQTPLLRENLKHFEEILYEMSAWDTYDPKIEKNLTRIAGLAENLFEVPDGVMDGVFLINVVGKDTFSPNEAFEEICRVLIPGGRVFIANHPENGLHQIHAFVRLFLQRGWKMQFQQGPQFSLWQIDSIE